jgi:hypothetical protein
MQLAGGTPVTTGLWNSALDVRRWALDVFFLL